MTDDPAAGRADAGVFQPGGQPAPQSGEHLVVVGGRAVRDRDDQVPQLRITAHDLGIRDDRQIMQLAALPGEPPLPD